MGIDEKRDAEVFSQQLSYWLKMRGVTQASLADKLGMSESAVSFWCKGTKVPRIRTVARIAEILNISVNDLMYEPTDAQIKQDELFDKKRVLFKLIDNVDEEDLNKIESIIDMVIGTKYDD